MGSSHIVVDRRGIDRLIQVLGDRGYTVLGPAVEGGAIVHREIARTDDLPVGLRDEHAPGVYRVVARDDDALFGFVVGPTSPKATFHPAETTVWSGDASLTRVDGAADRRFAFIGVRACELAAVAIQDTVFLGSGTVDRSYAGNRRGAFLVAVNCTEPGATCFCASMGTGPRATAGYDIALTEVIGEGAHHFVADAGSDEGAEILELLGGTPATGPQVAEAAAISERAAGMITRTLETEGIEEMFRRALESPRWEGIAARCLTCANCTMVCPTCFCSTVDDSIGVTGLGDRGAVARRVRRWDSCFNLEFSLVHGGPHRLTASSRYRQWMTHKLASWHDQFGTSGCVGCGRCITWCPVGIDIAAEVAAFWEEDRVHA